MIASFKDGDTRELVETGKSRRWTSIGRVAMRKLRMVDEARELRDLRAAPANHLEALKGDRAGQHSIRVNRQWRVCFRWNEARKEAIDVEVTDYH